MIRIMIDSTADIPKDSSIIDYYIPLSVNIDGKDYLSGIEINNDRFYELLVNAKDFPQTSQPATQSFVDAFEEVKANGDELIVFTISSELSGTYQGAVLAKSMVDYDKIHLIDTLGATHIISVMVEKASSMRASGASAEEIVSLCEDLKSRVKVFAGVNTLEYLRKGGRLSNASAIVGELAKIRPIITVVDGKVEAIGKCIGKKRAMQFILDKVNEYILDEDYPIYSLYTAGTENCESLEEKLMESGYKIADRRQVGSTIGAHIGPGVYAVVIVTK